MAAPLLTPASAGIRMMWKNVVGIRMMWKNVAGIRMMWNNVAGIRMMWKNVIANRCEDRIITHTLHILKHISYSL